MAVNKKYFLVAACLGLLVLVSDESQAGQTLAWGSDAYQLVTGAPSGDDLTAIAVGPYNGFALRSDGSIAAWGNDDYGQVSGAPTGTGFTAIAAGEFTGLALRENVAAVPEPSSIVMAGLSLASLVGMAVRSRGRRG